MIKYQQQQKQHTQVYDKIQQSQRNAGNNNAISAHRSFEKLSRKKAIENKTFRNSKTIIVFVRYNLIVIQLVS